MPLPSRMPPKRSSNKVGEYSLVSGFKGYHAREDPTLLPENILVSPSQNVVINTSGRVSSVRGYTLDGQASTDIDSGILSNYDFTNFKGDVRNLRAGFLTSAGNDGKLQFRYESSTGTVSWVTLKTALSNVVLSFCDWWDASALVRQLIWVDGGANMYSWNGAVTTVSSATVATVTKEGTNTWAQEGFKTTYPATIVIGGVAASYTGGATTTTLTGVSYDFSTTTLGTVVHQQFDTTSSFSSMPLTTLDVVGCGRNNQVYIGSSKSSVIYISKPSSFSDYSFSSPRVAGEGFSQILSAPPTKFIPQESQTSDNAYDMFISEGKNIWSVMRFVLNVSYNSSGVPQSTIETASRLVLKTAPYLGAMSERLVTKMKNHIVYVAHDKTINFFGYLSYQYVPVITDFSYPIIDDQNSYDLSNGSIFYHKNYIYEAVPEHGLVRIYNMTDQSQEQYGGAKSLEDVTQQPWFWEAPVGYPVSGFYVVDGDLYGHSFTTSESYKLFDGGTFNGQDIIANATFAYTGDGDRTQSKGCDELYVEGYIKQNTDLMCTVTGDIDSFKTAQTVTIEGDDSQYVAFGGGGNSLGDSPLGVQTLGGNQSTSSTSLPAWFHVSLTFPQVPFYQQQISFRTQGADLQWEILTFGTNSYPTAEGNNSYTK